MFEALVLDDPIAGDRESLFAAMEGRMLAMSLLCLVDTSSGSEARQPGCRQSWSEARASPAAALRGGRSSRELEQRAGGVSAA